MFSSASSSCRRFPDIPLPLLATKMTGFLSPVISEPGPARTSRCGNSNDSTLSGLLHSFYNALSPVSSYSVPPT